MEKIAKVDEKVFTNLAQMLQKMGDIFFDWAFGQAGKGARKYISDVVTYNTSRERDTIIQSLRKFGANKRNGMFGYSTEDNHIHIIHDCAWANQSCRCAFRREILATGCLKPARTESKYLFQLSESDWYNVFIYFFLSKRGERKIWVDRKSWTLPTDSKYTG